MDISFKDKKFQKICNSGSALVRTYGKNCAKKIRVRLDDLQAATNLAVFRNLPGRCHELIGNKKGQLSLDLEHPLRLLFEPSNHDVRHKADGGLDWGSVSAVSIINVEDTHE